MRFTIIITILAWCYGNSTHLAVDNFAKLMDDVSRSYNSRNPKHSIPLLKKGDPINVNFEIWLFELLNFDMKAQSVELLILESMDWHDHHAIWNPSQYDGINFLSIPADSIWMPDITMLNPTDEAKDLMDKKKLKINVNHNGSAIRNRAIKYSITCPVDLVRFPFDHQECSWKYCSWVYDSSRLNITLRNSHILTRQFLETSWEIVNTSVSREEKLQYGISFVIVNARVRVRRKPHFYLMVMVTPGLLLSSLALIIFCLPPGASDKIGLGLTVFLSFFVLMLLVMDVMPTSMTHTPLIVDLFYKSMLAIFFSIVSSAIVVKIFAKGEEEMPKPLKKVFVHILAPVLLVRRPVCRMNRQHADKNTECAECKCENQTIDEITNDNENSKNESRVVDRLEAINKTLIKIDETIRNQSEPDVRNSSGDWYVAACVLDRLFFIGYFIFIVTCCLSWVWKVV